MKTNISASLNDGIMVDSALLQNTTCPLKINKLMSRLANEVDTQSGEIDAGKIWVNTHGKVRDTIRPLIIALHRPMTGQI